MWRIGLAFLIGQCCIHTLSSLPSAWFAFVLAAALVGAMLCRSTLVAVLVLGAGWAWGHAHLRLADDLVPALEGRDLVVEGRVASILDTRDVDPQFEFHVLSAEDSQLPSRLRLSWYDTGVRPAPGERWRFVVRLKRRSGFANPGGFDYEGYLFRVGIGATGYVRADSRNTRLAAADAAYRVLRVRAWLAQRIALAVGDTPMLGILQGLAVGDTQAMLPEQWRVFAATGTSHLMAISGLHVSMVAALAALLGGQVVRLRAAQRWRITAIHGQAIGGCAAALGYSLLAGMSIPTQRTLVMLGIYFAARWSRRVIGVENALGLSLIGVLIVDPFAPISVGAWLSFGAVAVIVIATAGRLRKEHAIINFTRVQWGVTVGLLPILVIAFGSLSLVSPLANAIAIPLFTLVLVPLILLGTAAASCSIEIGGWFLNLAVHVLEWCWPALDWIAHRPLAMWYPASLPLAHQLLLILGVLLFVLPSAIPVRFAAFALCLPAALYEPARPDAGGFELAMLDVGQGLAVVVVTRSHALVYDTGPAFRTGRDTGELVVLPYLRSRAIRSLDRLIVSHGDLDHRGGLQTVLAGVPTRSVLLGPSVSFSASSSETCIAGQRWTWDGVEFQVLHPRSANSSGSRNDSSCVVKISGIGASALLTGDIEEDAEAEILERTIAPVDIVTIAHHGSRSSSTTEFVAATQPKYALVSAGYRNRWNFPKRDIVERWLESGADVVSTVDSGAVEMTVSPNGVMRVRHYREDRRRYWSAR